MGHDTRLIFASLTDDDVLQTFVPSWAVPRPETLTYDDLIDRSQGRVLGVAHGESSTLVMDPTRSLSPRSLRRWARSLAPNGRVLSLDLCETRDDYEVSLYEPGRETFTATWKVRARAASGPRARASGLRLPRVGSTKGLLDLAARLGFDENPLGWTFAVWSRRAPRRSRAESSFAFGPPFLRMLVLAERSPKQVLTLLARHATLRFREPLRLDHVLEGCLGASQIAVGACGTATVLFDESGSLAFDLRWLLPEVPSRALALWGNIERPDAASSARHAALGAPSAFGYALRVDGELQRRATWVEGRVSSTASNGIPAALVSEVGAPLAVERALRRAKRGARLEDVLVLMRNLGFDPAPLGEARLHLYKVEPRRR